MGQPVVETPQPGMKKRLYAIARFNRALEDLEIAQCLFASDELIASLHVGVIAHGNGIVVRNCVFRGHTKDAVVYWTPGSTGHAMRNCLFDGMYSSTVWTAGIAGDFDYRNNVVTGANYVWIYQSGTSAQADAAGGRAQLPGGAPTDRSGPHALQGRQQLLQQTQEADRHRDRRESGVCRHRLVLSGIVWHQDCRSTGRARTRFNEAQLPASCRGIGSRRNRSRSLHETQFANLTLGGTSSRQGETSDDQAAQHRVSRLHVSASALAGGTRRRACQTQQSDAPAQPANMQTTLAERRG